jgi:hypothetical protein
LRETREFAVMLSNRRRGRPAEQLTTVTWFEVSGPPLCAVTFQIALREASLWLTSTDLERRAQTAPPIELRLCPSDVNMVEVLRVAGRAPIEPDCALHAKVIVRPQQPIVVILVVPNFTADATSLNLLVDRLTGNYERMIRMRTLDWTTPSLLSEPRYADFVTMQRLAERVTVVSTWLSDAIWLEHRHLIDPIEDPSCTVEGGDRYGQVTLRLLSYEWANLVAARRRHRATFTMLTLSAWSTVLGMITAADKVAVLLNTTARQLDGLEEWPGFFYDLGVAAMPTKGDSASAIAAGRRAVLDHHANYVPSGILCDLVPAYRAALVDPKSLLVAVQAKAVDNDSTIRFGHGYRTATRAQISHDAAFSLPIDGLMTLETDQSGASVVFEYGLRTVSDAAATDLAFRFRQSLTALTR